MARTSALCICSQARTTSSALSRASKKLFFASAAGVPVVAVVVPDANHFSADTSFDGTRPELVPSSTFPSPSVDILSSTLARTNPMPRILFLLLLLALLRPTQRLCAQRPTLQRLASPSRLKSEREDALEKAGLKAEELTDELGRSSDADASPSGMARSPTTRHCANR